MPEWVNAVLPSALIFAGVLLTVTGGVVGSILTNRVARHAAQTAAIAAEKSQENDLIDQLQEELRVYREDAGRRATLQDERLNRLETNNDGYRAHIHELRSHIWDRKEPPPPDWPTDLPR